MIPSNEGKNELQKFEEKENKLELLGSVLDKKPDFVPTVYASVIASLIVTLVVTIGGLILKSPYWFYCLIAGSLISLILSEVFLIRRNKNLLSQTTTLKESENKLILKLEALENENKELADYANSSQQQIVETGVTSINNVTGYVTFYTKLEDSEYYPDKCLPRINRYLDFMGNGASKWTWKISPENLKNALDRIEENGGEARFLTLNPLSEKVSNEDSKRQIIESLRCLRRNQRQRNNEDTLKIKVYDHSPQFRLTFIDKQVLVIGHYGGGDSNNSPLLEFRGDKNSWNFYNAFSDYYQRQWDDYAKEPNWEEIEKLYR